MRFAVAIAIACLAVTGLTGAAEAQAVIKHYDLKIPRQPLDTALKDLAQQTGLQVGRFSDAVKGDTLVGPLAGAYTAEQALERLLASSGLTYLSLNERAIIVLRPEDLAQLPAAQPPASQNTPDSSSSMNGGAILARPEHDSDTVLAANKTLPPRLRLSQSEPAPSAAQSSTASEQGSSDKLEDIVVTATKRAQSVQEVPLSISAFDAESYRELSRGTLDGLAAQITNLQAYATNTFLQSVHIRGIGLNEFQGQYDSPVAQHIDEVYVAKPWMTARRQYDIERVEVLKGPQGTLFGRNTTGGAINYYTHAPEQAFGASIELGFDEYERYRATGMVNGGLNDTLAARFSFNTEFGSGGPQKNLYTGKDWGAPDLYDLRGQLQWKGDNLTVRALLHGGRDKSEKVAWKGPGLFNLGGGICPQALTGETLKHPELCSKFGGFAQLLGHPEGEFEPKDAFTINVNTPPKVNDTFYGGYLRFDYNTGLGTFSSITGSEYYQRRHNEDSQSDIFDSTSTHYYNKMRQFTQELRLTGDPSTLWHYTLGAFYEHDDLDDLDEVDGSDLSGQPIPGIVPPFANQFFAQFNQKLSSAAVFANLEYKATDAVTVIGGLRYTDDKTKVSDVALGLGQLPETGKQRYVTPCLITTFFQGPIGSTACPFLGPIAPLFNDKRKDNNVSGMLGLEWKAADDVMVYATATTGYRAGGYSLPFAGAATQFDPEKIFSQELGIKSRWLDRTVQFNAALFHYMYKNVQVNVDDPVSPLVPITRNIGKQENFGAEVDLEWVPAEHWFFKQGIGYLDAEYKDTDRIISTYGGPIPLEGKTPVNSPKLTYNGLAQYRWPFSNGMKGMASLDYRWVDKRYLEATDQPFDRADSYWLANVRAGITSADNKWEVAAYVTNVFDKEYITYINNISFFALEIYGEPRTFGGTISYRF